MRAQVWRESEFQQACCQLLMYLDLHGWAIHAAAAATATAATTAAATLMPGCGHKGKLLAGVTSLQARGIIECAAQHISSHRSCMA